MGGSRRSSDRSLIDEPASPLGDAGKLFSGVSSRGAKGSDGTAGRPSPNDPRIRGARRDSGPSRDAIARSP